MREEKKYNSTILDSVEQDISRLTEISERFSKIGSKPKLQSFVLYELIEEVSSYMKHRLPQNSGINIIFSGDKDANIKGDWVLLRWALENLMKNSVDAIGSGNGEIYSIISTYENGISLDIRDTGKGISRGDWKNIFQPGFSSKQRGWGLGLSLTQRIVVEIHGGRIWVLSSKLGETIFRLSFPL